MAPANMYPTAFYPASFQQPPTFGGEFHHPPQPSHLPPRGPTYGEFHFSYAGPREVSPPGIGGPYPPTPGFPGFGFVYGFFTPPSPVFSMHPSLWASPQPPPSFYGPPGAGSYEYQSYSTHCGSHTMRPPPFAPAQRCSCWMAHNNSSQQPGESYVRRYPVRGGTEFPPTPSPPAPQACGEPFPPSTSEDEQSLLVRSTEDHQHDGHERELDSPGRSDDSQEQDPRPTSPAQHERLRGGHGKRGKRHGHGPPPPGAFHGAHSVGPRPPPRYHAPPMPPLPFFCGQSRAPTCSCVQHGRLDPPCVGPPHPPPTGHFGRFNRGHPRKDTSIGRDHFGHRHKGGRGRHWHGSPPESGSDTDPSSEDHDDEFELPVGEANRADSGHKAGWEDQFEGAESDERVPYVVSEVIVRNGEDGGSGKMRK